MWGLSGFHKSACISGMVADVIGCLTCKLTNSLGHCQPRSSSNLLAFNYISCLTLPCANVGITKGNCLPASYSRHSPTTKGACWLYRAVYRSVTSTEKQGHAAYVCSVDLHAGCVTISCSHVAAYFFAIVIPKHAWQGPEYDVLRARGFKIYEKTAGMFLVYKARPFGIVSMQGISSISFSALRWARDKASQFYSRSVGM